MSSLVIAIPLHAQVDAAPDPAPVAFVSMPRFAVEEPVAGEPVAEAPVEAPAVEAAAVEAPVPEAPAPEAPAETSAPEPTANPCADALDWVATTAGLPLPAGVDYNCPSAQFSHHGAACWRNSTYCPNGSFIAINTGLFDETDTDYLRHVVAHEVCHIFDFQATGRSSEPSADSCAAAHGAP